MQTQNYRDDLKYTVSSIDRYQGFIDATLRERKYFGPDWGKDRILDYQKQIDQKEIEKKQIAAKIAAEEAKIAKAKDLLIPGKFQHSEAFRKVVKIKFLNGDCDFTLAEQRVLKEWFQEQGPQGAARMQEFYLKHILNGFPTKTQAYRGSALERIFARSKER